MKILIKNVCLIAIIALTGCGGSDETSNESPKIINENDIIEETLEDEIIDESIQDEIEDNPAEDNPVEDNPVEDNPVEDNPVEDNPVEDNQVEDNLPEDDPIEMAMARAYKKDGSPIFYKSLKRKQDDDISASNHIKMNSSRIKYETVNKISSSNINITHSDRYNVNDVRVSYDKSGDFVLENYTNRYFKSILVRQSSGNYYKLKFLSPISPYTKNILDVSKNNITEYVETSILFSPNLSFSRSTWGKSCADAKSDNPNKWSCTDYPTKTESKILGALLANIKYFMNSKHFLPTLTDYAYGQRYLNRVVLPNGKGCVNSLSCKPSSEMNHHLLKYFFVITQQGRDFNMGRLKNKAIGWQGVGAGTWSAPTNSSTTVNGYVGIRALDDIDNFKAGLYNTALHEIGHAHGYAHGGHFTYGYPDYYNKHIYSLMLEDSYNKEELPALIFDIKQINGRLYEIDLFNTNKEVDNNVKVEIVGLGNIDARISYKESESKAFVKFKSEPDSRVFIRVSNSLNDQVQSKEIKLASFYTNDTLVKRDSKTFYTNATSLASETAQFNVIDSEGLKTISDSVTKYGGDFKNNYLNLSKLCQDLDDNMQIVNLADIQNHLLAEGDLKLKNKGSGKYLVGTGIYNIDTHVLKRVSTRDILDLDFGLVCKQSN
jgi:hypothetical protein